MGSSLATLVDNMAAETMALPETAPASAQEESSKKVDEDAKSPTFLSFKSPTTWLSGNGVSQRSSGVIAPVLKHEYDSVRVPGCLPFEIDCALDVEGQHTISWKSDIQLAGSAPLPSANGRGKRSSLAETPCLPVGKCNLYTFPSVTKTVCEEDGKIKELTYRPTGDQLKALCLLVKTLAVSEDIDMTEQPDEVGAFPMHALVVSNDEMALELAVEIFEARPELLTRVHTTHRNGLPLFVGESFLHILCVNSQEAMLLTLLELSMRELTTAQVETLLHSQAHGVFFHDHPMVMYGGTALSYACVFDLRRAAKKMLDSGLVTLNDPSSRCKLTGFLPVHAVTANGLRKTLAWMTEELPIEDRADVRAFTTVGQLNSLELHSLQSLQLSAKLGNQRMFKDILRRQCQIQWVWGPVTQYRIDLNGIDSARRGAGDVMELLGDDEALHETQSMLLDTFIDGFLFKLFTQKWSKYGWKIHNSRRLVDLVLLLCLAIFGLMLKEGNAAAGEACGRLAIAAIALMLFNLWREGSLALSYYREQDISDSENVASENVVGRWERIRETVGWMKTHVVHVMVVSYLFAVAALLTFLTAGDDVATWSANGTSAAAPSAATPDVVHILGEGGEQIAVGADSVRLSVVWLLLTFGFFCQAVFVLYVMTMPFAQIHIFLLSVVEILRNDLLIFLNVFGAITVAFFFAMFFLYPRSGASQLLIIEQFNKPISAMINLLELALVGANADIDVDAIFDPLSTNWMARINLIVFVASYVIYTLISLILLMNLLIAMLSSTFEKVQEESTLSYRISFARCVLKYEITARRCGSDIFAGTRTAQGDYVYEFRSIAKNAEGLTQGGGGGDPFHEDEDEASKDDTKFEGALMRLREDMANAVEVLLMAQQQQQ